MKFGVIIIMSENISSISLLVEKKNEWSFDWNFLREHSPADNVVVMAKKVWKRKKGNLQICAIFVFRRNFLSSLLKS